MAGVEGDDGRSFGQPISFQNRCAVLLLECGGDFLRQRCTSGNEDADAPQILRFADATQIVVHRRNAKDDGDLFLFDRGEGFFRRKGFKNRDRSADAEWVQYGASPGKTVIHRQHTQDVVGGRSWRQRSPKRCNIADQVAVGQDGAFGIAGCAGSINNDARRVLVDVCVFGRLIEIFFADCGGKIGDDQLFYRNIEIKGLH